VGWDAFDGHMAPAQWDYEVQQQMSQAHPLPTFSTVSQLNGTVSLLFVGESAMI